MRTPKKRTPYSKIQARRDLQRGRAYVFKSSTGRRVVLDATTHTLKGTLTRAAFKELMEDERLDLVRVRVAGVESDRFVQRDFEHYVARYDPDELSTRRRQRFQPPHPDGAGFIGWLINLNAP